MVLPDEHATYRLMIDIASALEPGDLVTLSGDLGAGKTTFVRALIRHLADDKTIEVPSPTFTLMQTYDLPQFPLVHADLYRLSGASELAELGFDDLPEGTVVLLEWPDRAGGLLPPDRIDIAFTLVPKLKLQFRHARVTGYGALAARVERISAVRQFIAEAGLSEAPRTRMEGDASTRSYDRLHAGRPHRAADERAAPPRRPARAQWPLVQRHRASRRERAAVRRDGQGLARAGAVRAGGLSRRSQSGPAHPGRPRRASAWSKATRRLRSRSATRPRSMR